MRECRSGNPLAAALEHPAGYNSSASPTAIVAAILPFADIPITLLN